SIRMHTGISRYCSSDVCSSNLTLLDHTGSQQDFWLRLDNAAKIYPAVQSAELTSVFRLSASLKDRVSIGPFLRAVKLLEGRFPTLCSASRREHAGDHHASDAHS